jgi:hypothetical protein
MPWSKVLRTGRRYSRAKQHDLLRFAPVSQCWEAFQARVLSLLCVVLGFEPMKMSDFLLAAPPCELPSVTPIRRCLWYRPVRRLGAPYTTLNATRPSDLAASG